MDEAIVFFRKETELPWHCPIDARHRFGPAASGEAPKPLDTWVETHFQAHSRSRVSTNQYGFRGLSPDAAGQSDARIDWTVHGSSVFFAEEDNASSMIIGATVDGPPPATTRLHTRHSSIRSHQRSPVNAPRLTRIDDIVISSLVNRLRRAFRTGSSENSRAASAAARQPIRTIRAKLDDIDLITNQQQPAPLPLRLLRTARA